MSGWNLPPGCTIADIDRNAGYDEDDETPDERKRRIEIEKGEKRQEIENDDRAQ